VLSAEEPTPFRRPYRDLGLRLAALRQRSAMSQEELARAAGVSSSYVGLIERGRRRPEPAVLRSIVRAIQGDYDEVASLAGYIGAPEPGRPLFVPEDKEEIMRRLLRFTPRLLDRLDHIGDILSEDETDGES
jgi:transcriptional regulator with XRE-family HTH domain